MTAEPPKAIEPDNIGRVIVSQPPSSGATFPLVTEYGYGMSRDWRVVEHRFGYPATGGIQRYAVGSGARRFQFVKSALTYTDKRALLDFYDTTQGCYQSFTYPTPSSDLSIMTGGTIGFNNHEVVFDVQPLSVTELVNRAQTGLTFIEIISPFDQEVYTVASICTRFPTDTVSQALADQVQAIVPLVHIKVRDPNVPDIYFSDRRVTINGFPGPVSNPMFLPRLLDVGVPGMGDVLMSQSIDGRADNVSFKFGNADRALSALVNDTSLEYALIDLSLFHVQTNTLMQLWLGTIISWQIDGTAVMSVQCADGLYPLTQIYPPRTVSRQCWKPFNQEVVPGYKPCPFSEKGTLHGGKAGSCDYNFNSPNGCLAHGMDPYFGGHPAESQTVLINDKGSATDSSTRNIAASSILSDSVWGQPLPEIWCNYFGSPQRAFWTNCLVVSVRDESTFMNVLGIVGVGPIGQFEGASIQTNADGYKFIVAPQADGYYSQGFKYSGQLTIKENSGLGLRQSVGNDPAHKATNVSDGADAFCMGQGSPQYWVVPDFNFSNIPGYANGVMPYAAGTALTELRYSKDPGQGIQPSTAETHTMQVPIRFGLTGATFDVNGNRTLVPGLTNPFWIAANMYFRALGIDHADPATQLSHIVLDSITNSSGTGCANIADIWTAPIIGTVAAGYQVTPAGQQLYGYNLDIYNNTFTYGDSGGTIHTISINQAITAGYLQLVSNPGQEPQFMFQGSMTETKPLRDWLTEMLNCCLGYYCFEFGRLNLGIRSTAVPTDGFNLATMLYQSLVIMPINPNFEYLKIQFGNVQLQYQSDLAEYSDKDHAAYHNRVGSPLTSSMKSVGISTLSQGLRVAVSRTREEIGGILRPDQPNPHIEWDNFKRVTFKTTLLALSTEIGQVVKITHPDLPTYPGAAPNSRPGSNPAFPANTWPYRIKKWMLHSDWSVTVVADSCVDSMYDLEVGPQPPTGLGTRPMAPLYFAEPLGQWAPYSVQAGPQDALYPNEWTFDLAQTFAYSGDGSLLTNAVVSGLLPVNQFVPNCGAVDIKKGKVSWAVGGSIPGGTTLYLQVTALSPGPAGTNSLNASPSSEVLVVQLPSDGNSYTVTVHNIFWPQNVPGLTGWALFAGTTPDLISMQSSDGNLATLPTDIPFAGPLRRQTIGVPNTDIARLRLRATRLIHGGVVGARISAVDATSITSHDTIDDSGYDNWAGRVIAIIGRQLNGGDAPFVFFKCTSWDPSTGVYTLDRNPLTAPYTVQVDDTMVICTRGYDNSSDPRVIGDPGLSNSNQSPPHTGEIPHDPSRVGQMLRIIAGKNRGQSAKIIDNDATTYKLDRELLIDSTSVWIVTDPGWVYSKDVIVDNADLNKTTQSAIPINNYLGIQLLVEGVTINSFGEIVDDTNACVRMIYIPGVQGTTNVTTNPARAGRRKTILAR